MATSQDTTALDSALAFLISSQVADLAANFESEERIVIRNQPKAQKESKGQKLVLLKRGRPSNASKEVAAPLTDKPAIPGLSLPEKGTLSALEFIKALLHAGKRISDTGTPYTDTTEVRNDSIKAIAGFIGWDPAQSFGSQEAIARMTAKRIISGKRLNGMSVAEERQHALSLPRRTPDAVPDSKAKRLFDLQGRATKAADNMIAFTRDSQDLSRSEYNRNLSLGLAQVERERLDQINEDISTLEKE
jgi:hypothetical protein